MQLHLLEEGNRGAHTSSFEFMFIKPGKGTTASDSSCESHLKVPAHQPSTRVTPPNSTSGIPFPEYQFGEGLRVWAAKHSQVHHSCS